jgi:uncharacterized protein (TIGR03435 family)
MYATKLAHALLAALLGAQTPSFEVASVKPSNRSDGVREFVIQPSGRLTITGMSLKDLARRAYMASDAVQDESRVVGGPAWVSTDVYDIVAQSDGDLGFDAQGRPERLLAMLKTLLEDRFKLRVHTEPRQTAVYDLVLTGRDKRPGNGLKPSSLDCPVYAQGIPRPAPDPVRWCGLQVNASGTTVRVTAQGETMDDLAKSFQAFRSVGRPVRNQTGLEGRYDFKIEFMTTTPLPNPDLAAPPAVATSD